ncbi:molybdopterin-dependent oxidoreductase [Rubeoparvulum massiliense]|uniref:molybdopterin-dependent oxidoreductase n=1 Tax=Rubeoparvulum massiliense TaxID=1631346 RepID=UPI00065DF2E5|nr:molybdopterin-dependent oxidoreductase [Rubeoparvulum massiliense]
MTQLDHIKRNVCPRNCYGTCGILSYVQGGRLVKVEGDPKHGFSQGHLCAKGFAFTQYVYNEQRLKTPLLQTPRGSGNWEPISWEEAYERIAQKILELSQRYGSNQALGYDMFCGNLGQLHQGAIPALFNSMGAHTKLQGNVCLATGRNALIDQVGRADSPDPELMAVDQLIVIWGGNPAHTNVQQMKYVYEARSRGAYLVVIDPLYTATAAKADLYLQIRPGTDGLLALMILKILWKQGSLDEEWLASIDGWHPLARYLDEVVSMEMTEEITGVPVEGIKELAHLYAHCHPCSTWVGFGLQRHANGGQNVRAIHSLAQLLHPKASKFYYYAAIIDWFPNPLKNHPTPNLDDKENMRYLDINHFAKEALALQQPPLKFLWIALRNPWSQGQHLNELARLWEQLELVVTVDLYMSQTAERSDIVLPATTHFEEYDCNVGYWHHWIGLNEPAIPPYAQAKSDLQITCELTQYLNQLSPGFSNFPSHLTAKDWLDQLISPEICQLFGISSWEELREGPQHLREDLYEKRLMEQGIPPFALFSERAKGKGRPALPIYLPAYRDHEYPFQVLTPQSLLQCHSQYERLPWLHREENDERVRMHPETAARRGLQEGDFVNLYNQLGMVQRVVHLDSMLPEDILVTVQGGADPINQLLSREGKRKERQRNRFDYSSDFYDLFVEMKKVKEGSSV